MMPACVFLMTRVAVHMEIEETPSCPTKVYLAAALGCHELGITNKLFAQNIFALWMMSPFLELQLNPSHSPFLVCTAWQSLLGKFSTANSKQKQWDEPMLTLRRNVFLTLCEEELIEYILESIVY